MGEPRIDSLHDPYEDQLSAARYKAERDAAVQELQAMRERNIELWMESGMANELATCAEQKAERLGKLVWRLQNRLARAHKRERNLRKGMREWREKVMGAPVRTMSAYDLLPEEDLQALRWVREQGGLDVVKTHAELFRRLKYERDELRELARDYEKGLMPEGYEWPRYESGELVEFGDDVIGHFSSDAIKVRSVEFMRGKTYLREGCKTDRAVLVYTGVRVKRPAVPAGDGEPLEVGQTEWGVGRSRHEKAIDKPQVTMSAYDLLNEGEREVLRMWPRYEDSEPVRFGDRVKHRRGTCVVESVRLHIGGLVSVYGNDGGRQVVVTEPVFRDPVERADDQVPAADGEPLREGETVWNVKTGERYVVGAFASGCFNVSDGRGGGLQLLPSQLTHTKPEIDSWERIEEDLGDEMAKQQCGPISPELACKLAGDLVRRCRALAERSE